MIQRKIIHKCQSTYTVSALKPLVNTNVMEVKQCLHLCSQIYCRNESAAIKKLRTCSSPTHCERYWMTIVQAIAMRKTAFRDSIKKFMSCTKAASPFAPTLLQDNCLGNVELSTH